MKQNSIISQSVSENQNSTKPNLVIHNSCAAINTTAASSAFLFESISISVQYNLETSPAVRSVISN